MSFLERVQRLPVLGLGLSTEHGAIDAPGALDVLRARAEHPEVARFLEVGVETAKGLDRLARGWAGQGWPTTYHFLDVNLHEPDDLDPDWLDEVREAIAVLRPAWLCGDAGLWHVGPRDRNHMCLLPPILTAEHATELAAGIVALREATGLEVLPENPPGTAFIGDLHLIDFFARVAQQADTGLLLDVAHLAVYQRVMGLDVLEAVDRLPWDRVVEVHVAGGAVRDHDGFVHIEDDHGLDVLDATWVLTELAARRATNLRAVVVECERNPLEQALPLLRRVQQVFAGTPVGAA